MQNIFNDNEYKRNNLENNIILISNSDLISYYFCPSVAVHAFGKRSKLFSGYYCHRMLSITTKNVLCDGVIDKKWWFDMTCNNCINSQKINHEHRMEDCDQTYN